MGLALKWDITYRCNLHCSHCINGNLLDSESKDLSCKDIVSLVQKIQTCVPVDYIHFLGGEPTVHSDFIQICKEMESLGINFGFNTNAINFKTKGFDVVLDNPMLKAIVISLDAPIAEVNDAIRGKNVFNLVCENAKHIVSKKRDHTNLVVNTVVGKANLPYILDMIDFAIELGANQLDLLQLIAEGNASETDDTLTQTEEIALVEDIARKYPEIKEKIKLVPKFVRPIAKDYCNQVLGLDFPDIQHLCGAGCGFAFINNEGYIYPCDRLFQRNMSGQNAKSHSLVDYEFFDVWQNNIFNEPYEFIEGSEYLTFTPCNECKYFMKTCFPCYLYKDTGVGNSFSFNVCNHFIDKIKDIRR